MYREGDVAFAREPDCFAGHTPMILRGVFEEISLFLPI